MTQTDAQPTIIAHYAMGRIVALLVTGALLLAGFVWLMLHPESWTYYERKAPVQILMSQGVGLFATAMAIFLTVTMYGPWLIRGRGNTIRIQGGKLIYPGNETPVEAIADVRPDSFAYWNRFWIIAVEKRNGDSDWIYAWWLTEDRDVVLARLKEALARHRGAS